MTERTITINGEVHYPGIYKYADNETLEDFVLQAGGLKETASTVKVDVARRVSDPKALTTDSVIAHTYSFALKDGFVIDGQQGFVLQPFDEVYVRRSPAYSIQQNVSVDGKVMFPRCSARRIYQGCPHHARTHRGRTHTHGGRLQDATRAVTPATHAVGRQQQ